MWFLPVVDLTLFIYPTSDGEEIGSGKAPSEDRESADQEAEFPSLPDTQLLDTSAHRARAQLASSMPPRRPPTKHSKVSWTVPPGQ